MKKIKNIIDEQNMQIRELMKVTDTITCDGMGCKEYGRTADTHIHTYTICYVVVVKKKTESFFVVIDEVVDCL